MFSKKEYKYLEGRIDDLERRMCQLEDRTGVNLPVNKGPQYIKFVAVNKLVYMLLNYLKLQYNYTEAEETLKKREKV